MKSRVLVAMLVAAGVASLTFAQTPELKQSASPTSNQYRIRIAEPLERATITGRTVTLVIAPAPPVPEGTAVNPAERQDALKPTFQIWVDGKDFGNLPSNQNVFTASDLTPGPHTIVIAAKNGAGQVIDRKELTFTTVEATAAAPQPAAPAMAAEAAVPPAPPVPASPPAPGEPMTTDTPSTYSSESETLPTTATAHPGAAAGGLALLGLGLALRWRR